MRKELKEFVLSTHPKARPEAIVQGPDYRFTVLTDRLIRLEYQAEGRFMDDATLRVICREFPCPEFRVRETEQNLEIVTKELHLYYDKKPFSPEGLPQGFLCAVRENAAGAPLRAGKLVEPVSSVHRRDGDGIGDLPGLNLDNEAVRAELGDIADFWLDLGVDGFRLDAAKEFVSGAIQASTLCW